jgi:prolyl-tRNA synthetase
MAIAPYIGIKSQSEKFAGAKNTYTVEIVAPNGKALQACTSHDLADNFAKVFDVSFLNEKGEKTYVHQSSFGLSTRSIGALVLVHGDDLGLVIPPFIAPIQVVILPITKKAETDQEVLDFAKIVENKLKEIGIKAIIDKDDTHSLGYKINE